MTEEGLHFEKTLLGNEIMTGSVNEFSVLSEISLFFLESTGWYTVKTERTQKLFWGHNKSCSFLDFSEQCHMDQSQISKIQNADSNSQNQSQVAEKQSEQIQLDISISEMTLIGQNDSACSPDFISKSQFQNDFFAKNCQISEPKFDSSCLLVENSKNRDFNFEEFGERSRCFLIDHNNQQMSACVNINCKYNSDNVTYIIGKTI